MTPLISGIVFAFLGVAAWKHGYWCGHRQGFIAGAARARLNIEIENIAEQPDRVHFTCYPTGDPMAISPELVKGLVPCENDTTAIILDNGMVVPVAETFENIERVLR